ncbi:MAG: MerR family transcriptional regulator [Candidatus Omnitrophica bacterium]|nr:MerR family transcriptional regulator [Candidatus Omnitrophota bacterium]
MESEVKRLISAREIQVKYHISLSSVNYYTNLGLLPVAGKRGNKRLYDPDLIRKRMKEIHRLKREGFPLRLIQRHFLSSSEEIFPVG